MATMRELIFLLKEHGGVIARAESFPEELKKQAIASNRIHVDPSGVEFIWEPDSLLPETEEEVELFERWYPLKVELPESLKFPTFLFSIGTNNNNSIN